MNERARHASALLYGKAVQHTLFPWPFVLSNLVKTIYLAKGEQNDGTIVPKTDSVPTTLNNCLYKNLNHDIRIAIDEDLRPAVA